MGLAVLRRSGLPAYGRGKTGRPLRGRAVAQPEDVSQISLFSMSLGKCHDPESIARRREWAVIRAKKIIDSSIKENTLSKIEDITHSLLSFNGSPSTEPMNLEVVKQIYGGMAASIGIDLDNKNDTVAQIVRIGIKDLDPTRILRNCRHFYIALGSIGLPARMLQLYTAGHKTLYCTFHRYGIGTLSLDDAYDYMKENHCSKCKDKSEHPKDWKWSREWQQEQFKLHGKRFKSVV